MPAEFKSDRGTGATSAAGWRASWRTQLPALFVVLCLIALILVPIPLQRRIDDLREVRSEAAQPARDLVTTIHASLALEMSALRGFVITGDPEFLDRYEEALEREREAYAELEPLLRRFADEALLREYAELRELVSRWHGRVTEARILSRELVPEEFIERIESEQALYEEVLEATVQVREAMVRIVANQREAVQRIERLRLVAMVLLVTLALIAALVVVRLNRLTREAAAEAESRRAEIERVMADRQRLMRGITHDLKNPLGAADMHAQLLTSGARGELDAEQADSIRRIRRSIRSGMDIIEDLLRLSRAQAGQLEFRREPTPVEELVREVVEEEQAAAENAELTLRAELAAGLPTIETDPGRVREVLRNLISNAVKYTPKGGQIRVDAELRSDQRAPGPGEWLAIDVSDTGPGIPPDEQEEVFVEFTRLGEAGAHGSGLGLAISRHIARALDGDITVVSEPGAGSTFTFWLPRREVGRAGRREPEG